MKTFEEYWSEMGSTHPDEQTRYLHKLIAQNFWDCALIQASKCESKAQILALDSDRFFEKEGAA